jgi:hypothetical protein
MTLLRALAPWALALAAIALDLALRHHAWLLA